MPWTVSADLASPIHRQLTPTCLDTIIVIPCARSLKWFVAAPLCCWGHAFVLNIGYFYTFPPSIPLFLPSSQPLHPTSFSPFRLFFPALAIECYIRVLVSNRHHVSFQLHLFIYFWCFRICAIHISASLSLFLIPQTCKRCLFRLSLSWKTERCCHWIHISVSQWH